MTYQEYIHTHTYTHNDGVMESSINLTASKLDLLTLEELRDPNLISRYPPLFQRRQNYVDIKCDSLTKIGRPFPQPQQQQQQHQQQQ